MLVGLTLRPPTAPGWRSQGWHDNLVGVVHGRLIGLGERTAGSHQDPPGDGSSLCGTDHPLGEVPPALCHLTPGWPWETFSLSRALARLQARAVPGLTAQPGN